MTGQVVAACPALPGVRLGRDGTLCPAAGLLVRRSLQRGLSRVPALPLASWVARVGSSTSQSRESGDQAAWTASVGAATRPRTWRYDCGAAAAGCWGAAAAGPLGAPPRSWVAAEAGAACAYRPEGDVAAGPPQQRLSLREHETGGLLVSFTRVDQGPDTIAAIVVAADRAIVGGAAPAEAPMTERGTAVTASASDDVTSLFDAQAAPGNA